MTKLATLDPGLPNPSEDDRLSALLDGELDADMAGTVIKGLSRQGTERERFLEYYRIGDALRGLEHGAPDLTRRVMAALEREPTVLAPMGKTASRRPALWLAAATVAAIAWGLWQADPRQETAVPMAALPEAALTATGAESALPYLAAHQDYTQAVVSPSEMRFTRVTLVGSGQ